MKHDTNSEIRDIIWKPIKLQPMKFERKLQSVEFGGTNSNLSHLKIMLLLEWKGPKSQTIDSGFKSFPGGENQA